MKVTHENLVTLVMTLTDSFAYQTNENRLIWWLCVVLR